MSSRTSSVARLPIAAAVCVAALVLTPCLAWAQTPYIPYFGKNQVRYDNFEWQIYETDHFEIFYYPRSSRIWRGWPGTPKARISTSAGS